MSETPEIPEAEDPFGKRVAITIAILAVVLSLVSNHGDNAKTDALISTSEAANQWAYFQSKSIKESSYTLQRDLITSLSSGIDADKQKALIESYAKKIDKYEHEKEAIGPGKDDGKGGFVEVKDEHGEPIISAKQLHDQATHSLKINDRCDLGALLLQMGVILCSIAILVKLRPFWFMGIATGAFGAGIGLSAFFM